MTNTTQEYDNVISKSRTLFINKMKDYGSAWRILRISSLTDQIFIKAQRIRSLQQNTIQKIAEDESSEFIGIINYSVMALIQLDLGVVEQPDLDVAKATELYDSKIAVTKELMENKNHDYGEAWREMRISSLTDLILQKLLRVKQIEDNQGKTLVSEGIEANYQDMLNYSVFALILIDSINPKKNIEQNIEIPVLKETLQSVIAEDAAPVVKVKKQPSIRLNKKEIFLKGITQFSRIIVGLLFIISGLIKLNDPIGFSYKLAEYFGEPVFNLPFLIPFSLTTAYFLVILEIVLGVMLLIGYKSKVTIWNLLVLIIMFSFLTFYSAFFDVVKDCGCFGDALHLTPWESFTKDIVLMFFILILFFNKKIIKPLFANKIQNAIILLSLFLCLFMGYWVYNHLPIKDFRPYQVGNNIQKGMKIPEGATKSVIEMVFIYNINGVDKEFTEKDLASVPAGAKFVDRKDNVITEGYVPPIHDFVMEKEGSDYKEELLEEPKLILIVAYDLAISDSEGLAKMEKLNLTAKSKGYKVIGMTASSPEEIAKQKKKYGFTFDFYFCDGIALKTIERANPSVIRLKKGTIKQKVHYNDIADLNY
jgi:uncharacterized membrane protein YphA (DoxX/SURF4 family)